MSRRVLPQTADTGWWTLYAVCNEVGLSRVTTECFDPNDRDRMLGVIEASYGTLSAFNDAVRSRFTRQVCLSCPQCLGSMPRHTQPVQRVGDGEG